MSSSKKRNNSLFTSSTAKERQFNARGSSYQDSRESSNKRTRHHAARSNSNTVGPHETNNKEKQQQQQASLSATTDQSLNTSSASSSGYNSHNNFYSHQRRPKHRVQQQYQYSESYQPEHFESYRNSKPRQQQPSTLLKAPMMIPMMIDAEVEVDGIDDTHLIDDKTDRMSQYNLLAIQRQQHQFGAEFSDQCVDSDTEDAYFTDNPAKYSSSSYQGGLSSQHHPHLHHLHHHLNEDGSIDASQSARLSYHLQQQVLDATRQQQLKLQQQFNLKTDIDKSSGGKAFNLQSNSLNDTHTHRTHNYNFLKPGYSPSAIYHQPQQIQTYQYQYQHPNGSFSYIDSNQQASAEPLPVQQQLYVHNGTDYSRALLLANPHSSKSKQQQNQQVVSATGNTFRKVGKDKHQATDDSVKNVMHTSNSRHQLSSSSTPDQHHYARRKNTTTSHKRSTPTSQLEEDVASLSWCGKLGKSLLFIANLLFWSTGIALGAWGILSLVDDHKYNLSQLLVFEPTSKMSLFQLLSWSFITLGCATILVGVCGCSAILKNNRWILGLYIFLILAIFALDLATGLLAIIFQERLVANVRLRLANKLRSDYGVHASFTAAIDYIQTKYECCGLESHFDYDQSLWRLQRLGGFEATVARTCCYLRNTFDDQAHINPRPVNESMCQSTDVRFHQSYRYRKGCMDDLERLIRQKIWTFTIGCGAVGGVILLSLFFATCFCRSIPSKSLKKSSSSSSTRESYSKGNQHQRHMEKRQTATIAQQRQY